MNRLNACVVAAALSWSAMPAQALQMFTSNSPGTYSFTALTAGVYRIEVGGARGGLGGNGGSGGRGGAGGDGGGTRSGPPVSAPGAGSPGGIGGGGKSGNAGAFGQFEAGSFTLVADQTLSIFVGRMGLGGSGGFNGLSGFDGANGANGVYAGGGGGGGGGGRGGSGGGGGEGGYYSYVAGLLGASGGAGGNGGFGGSGGRGVTGGAGGDASFVAGCFFCDSSAFGIADGLGGAGAGSGFAGGRGTYDQVRNGFSVTYTGFGGGGGFGGVGATGSVGRLGGAAAFFQTFNIGEDRAFGLNNLGFGFVNIRQLTEFGAVPEPSSWAMMIAGFGLVGAAMRRRVATTA